MTNLYIPEGARSMSDEEKPIFKIALQSAGGRGKTFSALSFPNPIVLNFDNNLQAFTGRADIYKVPFNEDKFVDTIVKRGDLRDLSHIIVDASFRPNRRDALLLWLNKHGPSFTSDQTIILDSWSKAQDGFDQQEDMEPHYTQQLKKDDFMFWRNKLIWSRDLCDLLTSLPCNTVVTFHEQNLTDESGKVISSKMVPLMQGKFVNKLSLYFSDWFRCWFFPKGTPRSQIPLPALESLGITELQLQQDLGLWQTKSDMYADCKTRIVGCPQFIRADYKELIRLYSLGTQRLVSLGTPSK